jgi:hypothetical protein
MTAATWPQAKSERLTAPSGSDLRQLEIQHNLLLTNFATYFATLAGGNYVMQPVTLSTGTTVTFSATAGQVAIGGVPVAGFAAQLNQAFGALGTVPLNTWALVAVDMVGNGTITLVSAAANYTSGYASEALAIAAMPAITASNTRVAYLTLKTKVGSTFVFATDGLLGSASGNVASATNFYSVDGVFSNGSWTASQIANLAGTVLTSSNY